MPPNFVNCNICGRQFGRSSLAFHQQACLKKQTAIWESEDPEFRGPKPGERRSASNTMTSSSRRAFQDDDSFSVSSRRSTKPGWNSSGFDMGDADSTRHRGGRQFEERSVQSYAPSVVSTMSTRMSQPFDAGGYGDAGTAGLPNCRFCGRHFAPERIAKHQSICSKLKKNRTPFDSARHRVVEDSGRGFGGGRSGGFGGGRSGGAPRSSASVSSRSRGGGSGSVRSNKWRHESQQLRSVIAAARAGAHGGTTSSYRGGGAGAFMPAEPEYDDREECPHCNRRFSPQAAERHIPKCRTTQNKPAPPPTRRSMPAWQGSSSSSSRMAAPPPRSVPSSYDDDFDRRPVSARPSSKGRMATTNQRTTPSFTTSSTARRAAPIHDPYDDPDDFYAASSYTARPAHAPHRCSAVPRTMASGTIPASASYTSPSLYSSSSSTYNPGYANSYRMTESAYQPTSHYGAAQYASAQYPEFSPSTLCHTPGVAYRQGYY